MSTPLPAVSRLERIARRQRWIKQLSAVVPLLFFAGALASVLTLA